jgi:serine phosphatase RsbU (regulator of sigma subunit)
VVLLTDGLIETMSPSGKLLGRKAIINALAGDHFDSPYESASRLLQLAVNHRGAGSQSDDITLAVLRV